MKSSALNSREIQMLCEDKFWSWTISPPHKSVMFVKRQRCSLSVRAPWWAEGISGKPLLAIDLQNGKFDSRLGYLVYLCKAFNQLDLKMQGKEKDIIQFVVFAGVSYFEANFTKQTSLFLFIKLS